MNTFKTENIQQFTYLFRHYDEVIIYIQKYQAANPVSREVFMLIYTVKVYYLLCTVKYEQKLVDNAASEVLTFILLSRVRLHIMVSYFL